MEISIVIPAYNEVSNVSEICIRLKSVLSKITDDYEIIFCVDPSSDGTEQLILKLRDDDPRIKMLLMTRKFGQPAATMAGLAKCKGNCVVVMDCDLQDPPSLIVDMYNRYISGYDVVHTRRVKRYGEKCIRLVITHLGYLVINRLSNTDIPRNVGEFKLLSRRAIDTLLTVKDKNIFLKGLVSYIGFKSTILDYERESRYSGMPNYSQLWGSIPLALNGIFCYSNKPLQYLTFAGFLIFTFSLLIVFAIILAKLWGANFASGIPSVMALISIFGGAILFSIGLVGEYIGRIFEEVKDRPRFIIDEEYL